MQGAARPMRRRQAARPPCAFGEYGVGEDGELRHLVREQRKNARATERRQVGLQKRAGGVIRAEHRASADIDHQHRIGRGGEDGVGRGGEQGRSRITRYRQ